MPVTPISTLDSHGVDTMLEELFQTVEDNYIRRTSVDAIIAQLNERIAALEMFETVRFEIVEDTLYVTFSDPEDETNLSIDSSTGNLVMVTSDPETSTEKDLEGYSFAIESDGNLVLTITL